MISENQTSKASFFVVRILKKEEYGIDDVTILRAFLDNNNEFKENFDLFKKFGDSQDEVELFIEEIIFSMQQVIQKNISFYQTCKLVLLLDILGHRAIIRSCCENCNNVMAAKALIKTVDTEVYPDFLKALSFLDE